MKDNCLKNSWIFHQDLKQLQKFYQKIKEIKINKIKEKLKKF